MFTTRKHLAILTAGAALAAAGATAVASTAASTDATVTIGPQVSLHAGQTSPFDAPGVKAVRRGKAIPSGYVLVGRKVTIDRGTAGSTGAVMKLSCPSGTSVRTIGQTGQNGPGIIGSTNYTGHHDVRVAVWSPPLDVRSTGMSYAVCGEASR